MRIAAFRFLAVASIAALVVPTFSNLAAAKSMCGIQFNNLGDLLIKITKSNRFKPGKSNSTWLAFMADKNLTVLAISTPENPAHPAVACRRAVISESGEISMSTDISCGGPKKECDSLPGQFEALDKAMMSKLKAQ